jgi:flagellar biosynthesis protein FlhG
MNAHADVPAGRATDDLPARLHARGQPRHAQTLAVASGKGGVGKTWFAVTLAHALARRGERVLLVDGDLGLANVDIQLGLLPDTDLGAVAAGHIALKDAVIAHDAGFDVLAGRSGSGALAGLGDELIGRLLGCLHGAAGAYDTILLDLGAGLDPVVRKLSRFADRLVLLVTDEPTSLTDGYAALKLYSADDGDLAAAFVVVNQAASRAAGERTFATLARACTSFLGRTPSLAGIVRRDDRVREAIRRQTPLLTRSPSTAAATDVEAIARVLDRR